MKGSQGWKSFEVISNLHLTGRYGIHMTFSALHGVLLGLGSSPVAGRASAHPLHFEISFVSLY